jgi:L-iditol 2-dehydrogenase
MKAARLYGVNDLRVLEEPDPQPAEGESLIQVKAVGLCGSDLHWIAEGAIGDAVLRQPLVLGHEFSGVIVSNGSPLPGEVQQAPGTRVAVDPAIACLACELCLQGHSNLCERLRFAGHDRQDGGLRQLLPWPDRFLVPIPGHFSYEEAALLEPLGVAIHAVDLGKVGLGAVVGIYGCGPIGLLLIQAARAAGAAEILVTDLFSHRLELALDLGADQAFLADRGAEAEQILRTTRGRGVDVAFEAAGDNAAVETAIANARPGGRVVLVGIPGDDRTSFTASTARRKGLTVLLCRRMKLTYGRAIALVERGKVELQILVSHRYSLDEVELAFNVARQRTGFKVIVEP